MTEPDSDADLRDAIGLAMVSGVGPLLSRALLEHFGSAGRVLRASISELRSVPGVGPKTATQDCRVAEGV